MIPICIPLSLTLCMNARDYTTEQTKGNSSPGNLLDVEFMRADIVRHGFRHQIVQG